MAYFSKKDLLNLLNEKVDEYNNIEFLNDDPLGVVHEYSNPQNIEIIGFLIATFAWGNRKSIISNAKKLGRILDHEPYDFVMNHSAKDLEALEFVHRTFNAEDLKFFIKRLRGLYQQADSLERHFQRDPNETGIKGRIIQFRRAFFNGVDLKHRSQKHLSNPEKGSSAKRINMFLRWMVRSDEIGVDFGLWKNISMSELYIPLDVHTGNTSRALGLTDRKANDWNTLEEIMKSLRSFDPQDPAKYDFALFGIGVMDELRLKK